MNKRTVLALDLAKRVIQVFKVNKHGEVVYNKAVSAKKLKEILANTESCIVAMEACGSFHYWGRIAQSYGHEVRAMPPKKVKPFVNRQKTDANDAVGVYIASQQPGMTFCPVKSITQQSIQALHTSRRHLKRSLTATSNHIRGLVYEYGVAIGKGKKALREGIARESAPEADNLPTATKELLKTLWELYLSAEQQLTTIAAQLKSTTRQTEPCKRLMALEGVGEVGAAGLYSSLGDGGQFKNGRQASAYIGVTPKQHSSGGKTVMIGIDKKGGDKALRSTLYLGALSVIKSLPGEPKTEKQQWLINLVRRVGVKRACIALVNKTIRTAWALLRSGQEYNPSPIVA